MVKEHKYFRATKTKDPNIVSLPETGLSNETIIKRIKDLIEYLSYCNRRKGVLVDVDEVREYVRIAKHRLGVIKQWYSKKWELTPTTEELQFTINLDHYEPKYYRSLSDIQRRYLDIFIFMCLQGTGPIDTKKIKETDIVRVKLIGDRRKTRNGFKVELDPVSEQVLITNNYDIYFVDQTFNEAVKRKCSLLSLNYTGLILKTSMMRSIRSSIHKENPRAMKNSCSCCIRAFSPWVCLGGEPS